MSAALSAALFLAGCSKNIDTTDAVRQGVMDYMNTTAPKIGLDLSAMQIDVTAVTFEQDHAHATVTFTAKGGGSMTVNYNLDRKGDKWVVNGNAQSAGSTHGTEGQQANPAAPPQTAPNGTQLPPGHPAIGSNGSQSGGTPSSGQLPPGHPPVGTKQ